MSRELHHGAAGSEVEPEAVLPRPAGGELVLIEVQPPAEPRDLTATVDDLERLLERNGLLNGQVAGALEQWGQGGEPEAGWVVAWPPSVLDRAGVRGGGQHGSIAEIGPPSRPAQQLTLLGARWRRGPGPPGAGGSRIGVRGP